MKKLAVYVIAPLLTASLAIVPAEGAGKKKAKKPVPAATSKTDTSSTNNGGKGTPNFGGANKNSTKKGLKKGTGKAGATTSKSPSQPPPSK